MRVIGPGRYAREMPATPLSPISSRRDASIADDARMVNNLNSPDPLGIWAEDVTDSLIAISQCHCVCSKNNLGPAGIQAGDKRCPLLQWLRREGANTEPRAMAMLGRIFIYGGPQ